MKRVSSFRILVLGLFIFFVSQPAYSAEKKSLEGVVKGFVRALYARDFVSAYRFIASSDRELKSKEEYLRENPPYFGPAAAVAKKLSEYIEFRSIRIQGAGPLRKVSVKVIMPEGFDAAIQELLDEEEVEDVAAETRTRLQQVEALRRSGKLPKQEGGGDFQLVREGSVWRVRVGWDEAVLVRFEGGVKMGLPWDFYPVRKVIRALPGETLQVLYKARNRSDREITAKATHIVKPENVQQHLNIIQCFCFIQSTLGPGEEIELPLTFRIDWDTPSDLKEMTVRYDWRPIEYFKKKWEKRP